MPASETSRIERVKVRVAPEVHAAIERAAERQGRSVTGSVVATAQGAAHPVIAEALAIQLSVDDQGLIADGVLDPPPNDALRRAAAAHRRLLGRGMAWDHRCVAPAIMALLPLAARAASFDCKAALSPQERLVCATPSLSALDDRLARRFAAQIARLSPEGQALSRRDERNWLAYTGQVCLSLRKPVIADPPDACLQRAYEARVADLNAVTTKTAGWTFQVVTFRRAVPVSDGGDGSGDHPGFATNEVSYLRIDAPSTAAARQWNERLKLSPAAIPDADTDVRTTMRLNLATPGFLSTTTEAYFYGHGRPHGHGTSEVTNVILSPGFRDATPDDLFKTGGGWRTVLGDAAFRQVQSAAMEQEAGLSDDMLDSAKADALSMRKWQIGSKGIVIQYDPYELGTYVFSPTVKIPWSDLRGELRPDSPIAAAIDSSPAR